jgi:hypothetical protein
LSRYRHLGLSLSLSSLASIYSKSIKTLHSSKRHIHCLPSFSDIFFFVLLSIDNLFAANGSQKCGSHSSEAKTTTITQNNRNHTCLLINRAEKHRESAIFLKIKLFICFLQLFHARNPAKCWFRYFLPALRHIFSVIDAHPSSTTLENKYITTCEEYVFVFRTKKNCPVFDL